MAGSAPRKAKPDRSAKENLMITKCSLEQVFPLSSALLSADSLRSPLQLQFQLKAEVQRGIEPSVRCLSSLLEFDGHLGSEFFPLTDHRDFFKTPRRQNRSELGETEHLASISPMSQSGMTYPTRSGFSPINQSGICEARKSVLFPDRHSTSIDLLFLRVALACFALALDGR